MTEEGRAVEIWAMTAEESVLASMTLLVPKTAPSQPAVRNDKRKEERREKRHEKVAQATATKGGKSWWE